MTTIVRNLNDLYLDTRHQFAAPACHVEVHGTKTEAKDKGGTLEPRLCPFFGLWTLDIGLLFSMAAGGA